MTNALTTTHGPFDFQLVLDTCCQGASMNEAKQLIAIASARGLNPLVGDCYFVKRWDASKGREVWAVQASIDSFRRKAEETGDYAGQDEPQFEYDPETKKLLCARVSVYRKSVPGRPFATAVAYWDEYVQKKKDGTPTKFWATMPRSQLAKCAETLALRKAFPAQLAKIYNETEMDQMETVETIDGESGEVIDRRPADAPKPVQATKGKQGPGPNDVQLKILTDITAADSIFVLDKIAEGVSKSPFREYGEILAALASKRNELQALEKEVEKVL